MSAERPALLAVEDLQVRFGGLRAVDGVDLSLQRGQTLALVGESGCGKSLTALSTLRLLPEPAARIHSGRVWLDGEDLFDLPESQMRKRRGQRIAMIFQEPSAALNPVLSIGEQIAEALAALDRRMSRTERRARSIELLHAVGMPDARRRLDDYPHQLSGGLKQRVMIAIALAGEADVLVADEPTTALDVTIQAQVLDLLRRLQNERQLAVLLITHDLAAVAGIADQVAVMYAGQIVEQAPAREFFARPYHPYSQALLAALPRIAGSARRGGAGGRLQSLGGQVPRIDRHFQSCRFVDRCPQAMEVCQTRQPPRQTPASGRWLRCERSLDDLSQASSSTVPGVQESVPRPVADGVSATFLEQTRTPYDARPGGEDLLQVRDLAVHFPIRRGLLQRTVGHVYAVDGVDLSLGRGETLALVGESGCGKTTVGKAIVGLADVTHGEIRLDGQRLDTLSARQRHRLRHRMQIIFQDPWASMNPRMRVFDILAEGLRGFGIAGQRGEQADDLPQRIKSLLELVGLPDSAMGRFPHEFSGGQRQRFCIARALAVQPELIVCDEPTSALDVSVQAQVLNLLHDLQEQLGLSYLFITHDIAVAQHVAHRIAVMYLGRIVEQGPVTVILKQPRHPWTQALLAAVPSLDAGAGTGRERQEVLTQGELPSASSPPEGCHFHPRCPLASERCRCDYPPLRRFEDGRELRCWNA